MVTRLFYIPTLIMKLNNEKKKYIAPHMEVYNVERVRLLNASAENEDFENTTYW